MPQFPSRLTEILGIRYPILAAPMAFASGGALAAAVSRAGGLGLIGGGYGDFDWIAQEWDRAAEAGAGESIGIGFITWSLARNPSLLEAALARRPRAVMLSFGDPAPFAEAVHAAGARLICQCQTLQHVNEALAAGADVIVAQGTEAGGHGAARGTFSFVPEVADLIARNASDAALAAAGGIADGRGLAAALMLGADGALVGTRFWASSEARVAPAHQKAAIDATGDDTIRTTTVDIARGIDWPAGFTARVHRNAFVQRWHGRESALATDAAHVTPVYRAAFEQGDPDEAGVWFGEAAGLIGAIAPAGDILNRMVSEAEALLRE